MILDDLNLCGETISQFAGYEAFKYLGDNKALASVKTNQKPSLPWGPHDVRQEAHEGKRVLAKFKARVAQLYIPRIHKFHYAGKLDFSIAGRAAAYRNLLPDEPATQLYPERRNQDTTRGGEKDFGVAGAKRRENVIRYEYGPPWAKVA